MLPKPVFGQALPMPWRMNILDERSYLADLCLGFFAASRSVFLRLAARFRMLSLPRLCPMEFFGCYVSSSAIFGAKF